LLDALAVVSGNRHARRDEVEGGVDLGFASLRWQAFVAKRRSGTGTMDRRALEVCVFVYLADALQTGDMFVVGAETFADYRAQLLPWAECEARLPAYCAALGIPERGADFAAALKAELTTLAAAVDSGFPANTEFSVDADGTPHLKQLAATEQPAGLAEFEQEVRIRMTERHLLDILKRADHWSGYTRHFGPPSGTDPKLAHAVQCYLFTVFGYGCNLGPGQTARHAPGAASAQALRRTNAQHVTAGKLEAGMVDVIDQYARFSLPGTGAVAARRSPMAPTSSCARTTCSALGTSATAVTAGLPIIILQTPTLRCSPALFLAACGRPSTSWTGCRKTGPPFSPTRCMPTRRGKVSQSSACAGSWASN